MNMKRKPTPKQPSTVIGTPFKHFANAPAGGRQVNEFAGSQFKKEDRGSKSS